MRFAMIMWVLLLGLAARGATASDLGPRWFHVDGGVGGAGGSMVTSYAGSASATLGVSHPLTRALRRTFEAGFVLVGRSRPGIGIPEFIVSRDASTIVSTMVGLELYGPIRGHSAPFLHGAVGVGGIAQGDGHARIRGYPGEQVIRGGRGVGPAVSLALGFRRLPQQGGSAPRASVRCLLVSSNREGTLIGSFQLGFGF